MIRNLCYYHETMGMECRGRHIPAVAQWLPSPHSHTAPINKIYHKYYYLTSWYNMYILTYLHFSWIKCVYSMQLRKKRIQNMYHCVPSVSHNVLDSLQLLFVNKYQQNIFYISQSYVFFSDSVPYIIKSLLVIP